MQKSTLLSTDKNTPKSHNSLLSIPLFVFSIFILFFIILLILQILWKGNLFKQETIKMFNFHLLFFHKSWIIHFSFRQIHWMTMELLYKSKLKFEWIGKIFQIILFCLCYDIDKFYRPNEMAWELFVGCT